MNKKIEKIFKSYFKKKISISTATIITFLLTGNILYPVTVSQDKTYVATPSEVVSGKELFPTNDTLAVVAPSASYVPVTVTLEKNINITSILGSNYPGLMISGYDRGTRIENNPNLIIDSPEIKAISKGNLTIKSYYLPAVVLEGHRATFQIEGTNSKIEAASEAIYFDATKVDILSSSPTYSLIPEYNEMQLVNLQNTTLKTESNNASLILANARTFITGGGTTYDDVQATESEFILSGANSLAEAAPNGWLAEAKLAEGELTNNRGIKGVGADLLIHLKDGARAKGLVTQEYNKEYQKNNLSASVTVVAENGATWELAPKGNLTEQKATLAGLNLINGGVLNAAKNKTGNGKAEYKLLILGEYTNAYYDSSGTLIIPGVTGDRAILPYPFSSGQDDYGYGLLQNKGGIITLANDSYEDKLTVEGHYAGENGQLKINTLWNSPGDINGGNSKSDLLHIMGDAFGSTTVMAVGKDGVEGYVDGTIGQISDDLNKNSSIVVKVDGRSFSTYDENYAENPGYETKVDEDYQNFKGTAITKGAGQIQLASRKLPNGGKEYYWTLTALTGGILPGSNAGIGINTPGSSPLIVNGQPVYILNPEVSGYVQMPKINMDMAYSSIATLHERRGENQIIAFDKYSLNKENSKNQFWTRIFKENKKVKGNTRFEYRNNISGVQVGNDFRIDYDGKGGYNLLGGYFSYVKAEPKFYDKYRAENGIIVNDKFTGDGKSEMFALGLTSTKYSQDGAYLDFVSQLEWYHNKYSARNMNKIKQKGFGLSFSAEIGKPFMLSKNTNSELILEPQVQLIYQYLNPSSFNDGIRKVDQNNQYAVCGRIGLRLEYNNFSGKGQAKSLYGIANITENFLNPKEVTIHNDNIKEKYKKTIGEIGAGLQLPISDKSYIYGDIRYEHSLEGNKYKGYRGTIGIKYTW